jgi:lipoprotein-releasing system permease protein
VSFRIRVLDVALVTAATVFISFLSTIFPSRSAARLDPVEALRYE